MRETTLRYDLMLEKAYRGVVREALAVTAQQGLPGGHNFYITFLTDFPGVDIPDFLLAQYPLEMTIVLEHQFWGLEVDEDRFAVTLSFRNQMQRLTVPLAAITAFADPSVKFGLEFRSEKSDKPADAVAPIALAPAKAAQKAPAFVAKPERAPTAAQASDSEKSGGDRPGEVVKLDLFRKK